MPCLQKSRGPHLASGKWGIYITMRAISFTHCSLASEALAIFCYEQHIFTFKTCNLYLYKQVIRFLSKRSGNYIPEKHEKQNPSQNNVSTHASVLLDFAMSLSKRGVSDNGIAAFVPKGCTAQKICSSQSRTIQNNPMRFLWGYDFNFLGSVFMEPGAILFIERNTAICL